MQLPGLVRLARPGNAFLSAVAVWAGALLAGAPLAPGWRVALGMVAAVAFAAAGNARNDLADVDVDRVAHPRRPLVTGEASLRGARALVVVLYATSLLSAILIGIVPLLLVLVALVLMEAYERALKARGLAGNVAIGLLAAAPFLMGAFAHGIHDPAVVPAPDEAFAGGVHRALAPPFVSVLAPSVGPAVVSLALLAGLATVGREVLKDVEDMAADAGRRRTLPLRVGARRAHVVAALFLVAAVLLSPLPWRLETVLAWTYLPAVGLADACFLAACAVGARSPARGQRLAKAGMALALVAVLVGRLPGGPS